MSKKKIIKRRNKISSLSDCKCSDDYKLKNINFSSNPVRFDISVEVNGYMNRFCWKADFTKITVKELDEELKNIKKSFAGGI